MGWTAYAEGMEVLLAFLALVALAGASARWGADSRRDALCGRRRGDWH
jgi:hypothetical protein